MADLPFTKPDGKKVWIPAEQRSKALDAGYREGDAPAEADQPVQAGVEGFARGATFGLSDAAAKGFGADTGAMQRRAQENPFAETVGEVGSFLVPFSGPSKLAKTATLAAAGKSLGTKLAIRGAEGTAYGLQHLITEQAFGDPVAGGERVAASIVGAALTGAVLEGVTHGLGRGASAVTRNVGGQKLAESLDSLAGEASQAVLKNQTVDKKALGQFNFHERVDDALKWAQRKGVFAGKSHGSTSELLEQEINKAGADLADIESTVQGIAAPDLRNIIKELRAQGQALSHTPAGEQSAKPFFELADSYEQRIKPGKEGFSTFEPSVRSPEFYAPPEDLALLPESVRTPLLDPSIRGGLKLPGVAESHSQTWSDIRKQLQEMSARIPPTESKGAKEAIYKARGALQDEMKAQMSSVAPALGDAWERANQELGYGLSLQGSVMRKLEASAPPLIGDLGGLAGSLAFSGVGSIPGLIAGREIQKFASQRGGYYLADALKRVSEGKLISKLSGELLSYTKQRLATAGAVLGPFRSMLESAAAEGADSLMETHLALARSDNGDEYLALMGLDKGSPEELQATGHKLSVLQAAQHGDNVEEAADAFFGKGSVGRPAVVQGRKRSVDDMLKQVEHLDLTRQTGVGALVSPDLLSNAPGMSASAMAALQRATEFLHRIAPRDPNALMPVALRKPWQPTKKQVDDWYEAVDALERPTAILEKMRFGEVPQAGVQAVKAVYPQLFNQMQTATFDRLTQLEKQVSYKQRLALASVFGPQFLGISPLQAQMYQMAHKKASQPAASGAGPDGRQVVDTQKNYETQSQRIERR